MLAAWLSTLAVIVMARAWLPAWVPTPRFASFLSACVFQTVLCASLGFAWAHAMASVRLNDRLQTALEGQDLTVVGVVSSLPRVSPRGTTFGFDVERAEGANAQTVRVPPSFWLGWYGDPRWGGERVRDTPARPLAHSVAQPTAPLSAVHPEVHAGERWRFVVRLKRPHGLMNPHGHDFERWLFEHGVGATGVVRSAIRQGEDPWRWVARFREHVKRSIAETVRDPRSAGVLAALAVGDQSAIEREDWDIFRRSGVAHLMSISGMHVTMFAWLAVAVLGWLWRRSGRACVFFPAPAAAAWVGLALAGLYTVLSGLGVPAMRTWLMLAIVTALRAWHVRWPWPMVLLVAAVAVTLFDPWALLQPGFWLSFVAVSMLLSSGDGQAPARASGESPAMPRWASRAWRELGAMARTQWLATVGLAPLTMVLFQQFSWVGYAANLIAIPVVTLLITPLSMLGLLWAPCWTLGDTLTRALSRVLAWMAAPSWATVHMAATPVWAWPLAVLAAWLLMARVPWRLRALALPLLLPVVWPATHRVAEGAVRMTAWDVGQGTAVLLQTARHTMVYDTGPAYAPEHNAGERVILPELRALGVRRLDRLMLSHRDLDHVGGAPSLLAELPVDRLVSSLEPGHPVLRARWATQQRRGRSAQADPCVAGMAWAWDGVSFEVLHPTQATLTAAHEVIRKAGRGTHDEGFQTPAQRQLQQHEQQNQHEHADQQSAHHSAATGGRSRAKAATPSNALSCVLRVRDAKGTTLLLTGDIERAQEAEILRRVAPPDGDAGEAAAPHPLRADVMLVPHHGSQTSSTAAWLEAVNPTWSVVQAGYRNRFHHPAPAVTQRLMATGTRLVRSDECGAWIFDTTPVVLGTQTLPDVECTRSARRRYWHASPGTVTD